MSKDINIEEFAKKINKDVNKFTEVASKYKLEYIEVYNNHIPKDLCDYFVKQFKVLKNRGYAGKGSTAHETKLSAKNSEDIYLKPFFGNIIDDWDEKHKLFEKHLVLALSDYMVNHGLFGVEHLGKGIKRYLEEGNDFDVLKKTYDYQTYCIRKYKKNIGHFRGMHADCSRVTMNRILAVIVYLNDVEEGGETMFPYLGEKIKPKIGSVLVFPSYFTHYHMASIPISDDKYCICMHIQFKKEKENKDGQSD